MPMIPGIRTDVPVAAEAAGVGGAVSDPTAWKPARPDVIAADAGTCPMSWLTVVATPTAIQPPPLPGPPPPPSAACEMFAAPAVSVVLAEAALSPEGAAERPDPVLPYTATAN